jgi:toxin-antitoxin system PIN domain toxin
VTVYLLDINVLIALIDPGHVHHDAAHDWFARAGSGAWATCPLTENGVLRIVGHPRYPNSPGSPAAVAPLLNRLCALTGHVAWPDDISILDHAVFDVARMLSFAQVTDSYLLALARKHGGKLATFDRRLVADAVRDGSRSLHRVGID